MQWSDILKLTFKIEGSQVATKGFLMPHNPELYHRLQKAQFEVKLLYGTMSHTNNYGSSEAIMMF